VNLDDAAASYQAVVFVDIQPSIYIVDSPHPRARTRRKFYATGMVWSRDPRDGSVAGGLAVGTDDFTFSPAASLQHVLPMHGPHTAAPAAVRTPTSIHPNIADWT